MFQSVVTSKGQTTIPKKIRELLAIKPNDKLFYIIEENKVIIKPIKGNILELRGSVPSNKKSSDLNKIRKATLKKVSKKIVEDG
jgi:antitoxin PrlF